jgi:hypothetical protein
VAAGSIPFPVAVGDTWVYQVVTSINNAHALDTKKVVEVTPMPGGHQVTMSDSVGPAAAASTLQHYLFYGNGQIGFPVKVWTAVGTGPVKTQQVVKAGGKTQLITTSELLSFTRHAAGS